MIDVLLVVDNYRRDYFGMRLVYLKLKAEGLAVKICGKYSVVEAVNYYKPISTVVTAIDFDWIGEISTVCYIIYLPSESVAGNVDYIKMYHGGFYPNCKVYSDKVDMIFCWGSNYKLGVDEFFEESKVKVTGNPMTDYYYLHRAENESPSIGLGSSFRLLNPVAFCNQIESIDTVNRLNGENIYFFSPYKVENWYAIEVAGIRVFMEIVRMISERYNVNFRPHPSENSRNYKYMETFNQNVHVGNEEPIYQWLKQNDVIISLFSTIFLDAYAMKKKSITIRNLLPKAIYDAVPGPLKEVDKMAFAPNTYDELFEAIQDSKFDNDVQLDEKLKISCNYDQQSKPAYIKVSEEIKRFLRRNSRKKFAKLKSGSKVKHYKLKDIYIDIASYIQKTSNPQLSYLQHRLFRNKQNDRSIDSVYRQLENKYGGSC